MPPVIILEKSIIHSELQPVDLGRPEKAIKAGAKGPPCKSQELAQQNPVWYLRKPTLTPPQQTELAIADPKDVQKIPNKGRLNLKPNRQTKTPAPRKKAAGHPGGVIKNSVVIRRRMTTEFYS